MTQSPVLIDVHELAGDLSSWTVLDASWVFPPLNVARVDVRAAYAAAHVPTAAFLDLAALSEPAALFDAEVPALAPPTAATLRAALAALDVTPERRIVVTDMEGGTATAPFARLTLLDVGFAHVRLLDGGTPAWRHAGLPLVATDPRIVDGPVRGGGSRAGIFVDSATTAHAIASGSALVVDARALDDNTALLSPAYRDVAIPANVVFRSAEALRECAEGQRFRCAGELRRDAERRGLDRKPVIVTCYFGVGSAVVATALEIAGLPRPQVDAASLLGWRRRFGSAAQPAG